MNDQPLILTDFTQEHGATNEEDVLFEYLGSLDYSVFAFVRSLSGSDFKPDRFMEIDRDIIKNAWYKMLFLVPRRLYHEFSRLVQQ